MSLCCICFTLWLFSRSTTIVLFSKVPLCHLFLIFVSLILLSFVSHTIPHPHSLKFPMLYSFLKVSLSLYSIFWLIYSFVCVSFPFYFSSPITFADSSDLSFQVTPPSSFHLPFKSIRSSRPPASLRLYLSRLFCYLCVYVWLFFTFVAHWVFQLAWRTHS